MTTRISITLEQQEFSALLEMAAADLRNPADELHFILRLEIERRTKQINLLEAPLEIPNNQEV